jgi:proteic killer suppression protein
MNIQRFKNKLTESLFKGGRVKSVHSDIALRAQNKLTLVFYAHRIESLAFPASNMLEKLKGDRKGQWSVRVNMQWRICFEWHDGQAVNIEFVDYH